MTRTTSQRWKNIFDQLDRTRWIKHNSGLLAEVVDLRENTVEMDRRGRLRWNEEMIGASLGKVDEVALGLDDHQVHIKRLTRVAPDCFDNHRPERDIRHKTAVHHVDMNPVRAGRIDGANLIREMA